MTSPSSPAGRARSRTRVEPGQCVLGAVKTEFDKFEACLTQTQNRLDQASRELDKLVGTRTRAIRRKLKGVTELSEAETQKVLDIGTDSEEE